MPVDLDTARWLAADVLRAGHFFSTRPLTWRHDAAETSRWEVFQGRLLDPAHTRQEATFETWNVHVAASTEPVLSLKLDAAHGVLHVVRGVENYVQEAYGEGNVIQTREARRWVRELIASFDLTHFDGSPELRGEVTAALMRAVTGTRLPLMPMEAPLPGFSFGEFFYFPEPADADAMMTCAHDAVGQWMRAGSAYAHAARLLELSFRATPTGEPVADVAREGMTTALLRVFDDVSLSPWTDFVTRVMHFLTQVDEVELIDFESRLLRLVSRHLTAYDLITFHHRGANYPDALLLDVVLNDYLARLERQPDLFAGEGGRIRRRALRQAYLLRRQYENHPVPDVPTTPGEHVRVLPDAYPRVPEEQILDPSARRRRLYENDPLIPRLSPLALEVLRQSVADLSHPDERQEMGAAVFLDRPFNDAKAPVEPDTTPLIASLATSRFRATERWRRLCQDLHLREEAIPDFDLPGLTLDRVGPPKRAATVSLLDAARAGPDFVYRFTLPGSVRTLGEWIDFGPHRETLSRRVLLARAPAGNAIWVYDESRTPLLALTPRYEQGYRSRRGVEYPAAGVMVEAIG